ncbi:MAG TPA: SCP2 sterol-binding domain-containing protein [Polyangiales bacterium]|jgi:putative sterol carrier protein|nr:SCP2 sterol-binding domain-containing protein [Polyangiales bacterium]
MALDFSSFDTLTATLPGLSDADIVAQSQALGVDVLVERMRGWLTQRFLPARAPAGSAVVQWNIETPDGLRSFSLQVHGGQCKIEQGTGPAPGVALTTGTPTFLRMITGRLSGLQAYSDRTLRVSGNLVLALEHQLWFDVDLSKAELSVATPRQLARLIEGRSDDELEAGISVTGIDDALRRVFQGMVDHYMPEKGPRKGAVIEFSVRTKQGDKVFQFTCDGKGSSFRAGSPDKPNVTLMLRTATFLRIASGTLDGLVALAKGNLKLKGNILLARNVQSWFDMRA